jgi:hypothetical protein
MMRLLPCRLAVAGLLLGLVVLAGCGSEEKLYRVSGTVTYNGQPIPKGLIFFDPDVTKGMTGPQGFANILDGKYDTAEMGKGVRGGAYVIRVNGYDGKPAYEAPFGQPLFPEYTCTKELPKEDSTFDVTVPKVR